MSGLSYIDKLQMVHATRNYHTTLNEAKGRYESRLVKDIASNPRRFYNYVKNYINPSSNIQCLTIDYGKVTSQADIAEILNDYFASVMTRETIPPPNCHIEMPTALFNPRHCKLNDENTTP